MQGNTLRLEKEFYAHECIFLNLGISKIKECLDEYYKDVGKLISIQDKKYIMSNISKWKLNIPGTQPKMIDPKTGEQVDYQKYKEKLTEGLMDEEDAIIMLSNEFNLQKLSSEDKYSSDDFCYGI